MLPLEIIDLIMQYIIFCKSCKISYDTLKLGNGNYYCYKCIRHSFNLEKR